MSTERISATRVLAEASPGDTQRGTGVLAAQVFNVLCDPHGHVAIDSSGMLQSVTGEPVNDVGDGFVVHMDREALGDVDLGRYDVTVRITRFERDREIAWTIESAFNIGHEYGYLIAPVDGGVEVTSYCDWSNVSSDWEKLFPVIDTKALRASLGILERVVRRGYVRGEETRS